MAGNEKTMSKGKKRLIILLSSLFAFLLFVLIVGIVLLRINTSPSNQDGVATEESIVTTDKGQLQGRQNEGIYNFLGVEYAHAEKLFVEASEVEPWEGIKTAYEYGPSSMQSTILGDFGAWISGVQYDNNCQNLNVWTPGLDSQKRPVMVWLHGGGFSTGSSYADSSYNGENLAKSQDVVVVSVNHRLNALGHFDLSSYGGEYKYSANIGIDDIVKALQWIQTNIEKFGGDPNNVTLFGQSGGGAKILALMTSPYAKGLFDKAIVQSGATETVGVSFTSLEASQAVTENILSQLGITAENIDEIQNVSYRDLVNAGSRAMNMVATEYRIPGAFSGYSMEWEPVVDFDYIPSNPVTDDSFAENGYDIPLLIGSNLMEWTRFVSSERVTVTDEIQRVFEEAYPNEPASDVTYTDTLIRFPMLKIMSHKADQGGANVYSYMFTFGTSTHGAEIPYIFANSSGRMNTLVSSIWSNFAKNGVPSASGLETWEPYTREGGACMILDETSYLAYHHDRELLNLIDPAYTY